MDKVILRVFCTQENKVEVFGYCLKGLSFAKKSFHVILNQNL